MNDEPIMTEQDLMEIYERVKESRKREAETVVARDYPTPPGWCHPECYYEKIIKNQDKHLADARKNLEEVTELHNNELSKPPEIFHERDRDGKIIRSVSSHDIWLSHIKTWRSVIRKIEVRMSGKEPEPTPEDWGNLEVDEL